MPEIRTITITDSSRLDVALSESTGKTRSAIKQLIEKGDVLVNGLPPKKSGETVKAGDVITLTVPDAVEKIEKKDIPIDILYEDGDVAVINKPQGLTVHPAGGNYTDTLVNALMFRLDSLSGINGEIRPGIVHRLDKDTSGVMIVAKNDEAHLSLSRQIADRTVVKEYVAILEGNLTPDEGRIETKIGRSPRDRKQMAVTPDGRTAVTEWRVITRFKENCFVLFRILTGRTHQIRVHAKHLGHPVVGDKTYGFKKQKFNLDGQLLHAYRLTVTHPKSGERMTFSAPLPDYFVRVYDALATKDGLKPFNAEII
mgnify:FL=1